MKKARRSLRFIGGLWVCILGLAPLFVSVFEYPATDSSLNLLSMVASVYWAAWLGLGLTLLVYPRLWVAVLLNVAGFPAAVFAGFQLVGWLGGYVAHSMMMGSIAILTAWMLTVLWVLCLLIYGRSSPHDQ